MSNTPAKPLSGRTIRTVLVIVTLFLAQCALAQSVYAPLLSSQNFQQIAPQGFGDRQNSWAWSMAWFNNKLYVGTERAYQCVQAESEHLVDSRFPYPPKDPDISCTPDPNDLPLQAEIWTYDPVTQLWNRAYQSPQDVPIPGTNPTKYVARDIGYRGMLVYKEADGTDALYVGGCSSMMIHQGVPGGRLLRTTDGVNFTPVPQDPGTVLGNLGNACFRGALSMNNQFFLMATNFKGYGTVLQSSNPSAGNNAFVQVSSPITPAYEIASFNNYLYVTFVDRTNGFSVGKTIPQANPQGAYTYQTIIANGGYLSPLPNPIALSMQVFKGSLYVGGDGVRRNVPLSTEGAELFRINADDSWDLIAGKSRSTPAGLKNSLSGLTSGLSWVLNQHMWRMMIYDNRLYVGTFDESTGLRNQSGGAQLSPEYGFDLWWTQDGTYFTQVDQNGFEDEFNIGARTLMATPNLNYGLFVGSANPFYGLKIYQGTTTVPVGPSLRISSTAVAPDAPQHVQVEGDESGALLAWDPPQGGATKYHVFRRAYRPTGINQDAPLVPTAYQEVGTTGKLVYKDSTAVSTLKYSYEIKADNGGPLSGPSNMVVYPSAAPPVTFADLQAQLTGFARRGKFVSPSVQRQLETSLRDAQDGAPVSRVEKLQGIRASIANSGTTYFADPVAVRDSELIVSRLAKRAALVQANYLPATALQATRTATTTPPTPPTQPTSGPGGSDYPYASVTANGPYWANNRYTADSVQYYIYEPATPTPATAPVILFLHGYGALTPTFYQGWINHMCQKGYIVVWAKYQVGYVAFSQFPLSAQQAWTDALYRLQNFTWEPHVRPAKNPDGSLQTMIVGHSFGGWIAAWLAGQASTAVPAYPVPESLVMIEPASLGLLPPINFAGISPATRMLFVTGDQDTVACSKDGVNIFTSTTQVPASQKNYLFFNSDSTGSPAQLGNHYFPTTNGFKDDNQFPPYNGIDARDYYVTYKLSVAAANCTFSGTDCDYFLGNGSANQVGMGNWSDGTVELPMSYYADPTTLPAIPGCAP